MNKMELARKLFNEKLDQNEFLIDPLTGIDTPVSELKALYGDDLVKAIRRVNGKDGRCYAKSELVTELRRTRKKSSDVKQTATIIQSQETKAKSGKHYTNINDGIFNNIKKSLHNPTSILLYLLQHKSWRGKNGSSSDWWNKGYIVAIKDLDDIVNDLSIPKTNVWRWLNELERDHYIERPVERNVFILGQVDKFDKEYYFYED